LTTQEIVSKLWNLCNVLRDDGITYHQYVTELTYILFLKMAKETEKEKNFPKLPFEQVNDKGTIEIVEEQYSWDSMAKKKALS
jgi:type I restriction enzyme M protein